MFSQIEGDLYNKAIRHDLNLFSGPIKIQSCN